MRRASFVSLDFLIRRGRCCVSRDRHDPATSRPSPPRDPDGSRSRRLLRDVARPPAAAVTAAPAAVTAATAAAATAAAAAVATAAARAGVLRKVATPTQEIGRNARANPRRRD